MPARLDYQQFTRFRHWRRVRRAVGVACVIAAVVVGVRYAGAAAGQARLLYWQDRCLSYSPPANLVVYEEGPGAAARLASGSYVPLAAPLSDAPAAGYVPDCWTRFLAAAAPWYTPAGQVPLYVQRRETPDGKSRLAAILFQPDDCAGFSSLNMAPVAAIPGTLVSQPRQLYLTGGGCGTYERGTRPRSLRIYAGQPHPTDATRFTIRYVLNGVPRLLRCKVASDGKFLQFE